MNELVTMCGASADLRGLLKSATAEVFTALSSAIETYHATELTETEAAEIETAEIEIGSRETELSAWSDDVQFVTLLQAQEPGDVLGLLQQRDSRRIEIPGEISAYRITIAGLSGKKHAAGVAAWGKAVGSRGRNVAGTRTPTIRASVEGDTAKCVLPGKKVGFLAIHSPTNYSVWEQEGNICKRIGSYADTSVSVGSQSKAKKVAQCAIVGVHGKMKNGDSYDLPPGMETVKLALTKGSGYIVNVGGVDGVTMLGQAPDVWASAWEMSE